MRGGHYSRTYHAVTTSMYIHICALSGSFNRWPDSGGLLWRKKRGGILSSWSFVTPLVTGGELFLVILCPRFDRRWWWWHYVLFRCKCCLVCSSVHSRINPRDGICDLARLDGWWMDGHVLGTLHAYYVAKNNNGGRVDETDQVAVLVIIIFIVKASGAADDGPIVWPLINVNRIQLCHCLPACTPTIPPDNGISDRITIISTTTLESFSAD